MINTLKLKDFEVSWVFFNDWIWLYRLVSSFCRRKSDRKLYRSLDRFILSSISGGTSRKKS
jgi:hypothetical protein